MHTRTAKILKILIAVSIVLFFVNASRTLTNPARTAMSDAASSPLNFFHAASSFFKRLIPFASLRDENRVLRGEVELLSRKLGEAGRVHDENIRLKDFLSFKKEIAYSTVAAQVIGRDPTNWSNSAIINKGANDGVVPNKAVLSTKGLAGRTVEVGRRSARIMLITDPNSKVGVIIERNRQGGILTGMPDGRCKMVYISLESDVASGDKVITAGFGEVFPKDILVGEVVKVGKEPGRLYKYAIVSTAEDLARLEEVLCIR